MRTFQLLVFLLSVLQVTTVCAENYSCRDRQGRLHLADSLANLPEECRDQALTHKSEPVDNLNYVPAPAVPAGSDARFEHSVREVERELLRKQQLAKQLKERAEQLAITYEAASVDKRRARRNWKYSSRETIKAADESIRQARAGKRQLLQDLSAASLSSQEERQIKATLERIAEE